MPRSKMKQIDAAVFKMDGYDKYSDREILDLVLNFAKEENGFTSNKFLETLNENLNNGKILTNKQLMILVRIISRWRILIK